MRIELENTGGLDNCGREPWANVGLAARYIGPLCERWSGSLNVVVESSPPNGFRRTWWHEVHWFIEADLGEFCQWAMKEYDSEIILTSNPNGVVNVEIYDDYRE